MIPFVTLGFGVIYAFFFWVIAYFSKFPELRTISFFLLVFFEPFGFNWFKPELILINSYFSTDLYLYAFFLLCVNLMVRLKKYLKIIPISLLVILSLFNTQKSFSIPNLNIAIPNIDLNQEKKWNKKYKNEILNNNFNIINSAIRAKKDLVVLPETAFPIYLNMELEILDSLKKLSYKIAIITGSLSVQNEKIFNSSYFFKDGNFQIASKVVLVPFGEKIPLPKWASKIINRLFFNNVDDYESAKEPFDFNINGYIFRNAICYEATSSILYQNNPKLMIAISNNAWFKPSIEPTLQKLLLKLYAKRFHTIIYHSANGGISTIITP